jgi:hypothetical protein
MQIPTQSLEGLSDKSLLEGLELINPGLPKGSIKGKVAWVHGDDKTGPGFLETGVQFLDASVDYTRGMVNYLITMAHSRLSNPDQIPEGSGNASEWF